MGAAMVNFNSSYAAERCVAALKSKYAADYWDGFERFVGDGAEAAETEARVDGFGDWLEAQEVGDDDDGSAR